MRREALAALPLVVAALAGGVAGCGDDEGDGTAGASAETAEVVCGLLRRWNDELGEVVNATSESITDDDDPTTANGVLLAGYDEMVAVAEAHVAELDGLGLPDVPGRDALLAELRAGAEESLAVLEDERAAAAELGPIGVPEQGGALGGAMLDVERATSVLEPRVEAYADELRRAFAADDGCTHVVQPTG